MPEIIPPSCAERITRKALRLSGILQVEWYGRTARRALPKHFLQRRGKFPRRNGKRSVARPRRTGSRIRRHENKSSKRITQMKKTIIPTCRQKTAVSINQSRWLAYATAGAATALGCGAQSAEGDITYSGPIDRSFTTPPQGQETFQHFALAGNIELDFQLVNIANGPFGNGGVAHFRLGSQGFFPGAGTQVVGQLFPSYPATVYLSDWALDKTSPPSTSPPSNIILFLLNRTDGPTSLPWRRIADFRIANGSGQV